MELVAYGKSDRPGGLFEIVLKFINFLIFDIQATHLLNMQEIHPAVMQLLVHIEYSIKTNMLLQSIPDENDSDEENLEEIIKTKTQIKIKQTSLRLYIIDFIKTLSIKVMPSPTLANFLFSDSRTGQWKGSYLPL